MEKYNIQLEEGKEITEEIENLIRSYDFYSAYIDDYTQYMQAERRNDEIRRKLKNLGVINFNIK